MPVGRGFAFQRWVDRTYARQQRPLDFRAQTVAEWQTWRARLREKIEELAGMAPPPPPCDLAPTVLERTELADDDLIREKVVYQSEPEVWVPAWLLRPVTPPAAGCPRSWRCTVTVDGGGKGRSPGWRRTRSRS